MSTMSKRTAKRKNTKVAAEPNQQLVSENVKDLAPEKASMAVELSSPTVKFEEDATTDGESPIMQLLIEKNKWQQKLITDLEKERDFLRSQLSATTSGSTSRNLPTEIKEPLPKVLSSSSCSSSEDETSSSSEEKKSKKKIRREKHRTGRARKPEEVIKRYKDVLKTFRKVRTMSAAFHRHGLDRGTIASTASIAELAIADPGFYQEIKKANKETLLDFAKRCNAMMSATTKQKIEEMKQKNELLPLQHSYN